MGSDRRKGRGGEAMRGAPHDSCQANGRQRLSGSRPPGQCASLSGPVSRPGHHMQPTHATPFSPHRATKLCAHSYKARQPSGNNPAFHPQHQSQVSRPMTLNEPTLTLQCPAELLPSLPLPTRTGSKPLSRPRPTSSVCLPASAASFSGTCSLLPSESS